MPQYMLLICPPVDTPPPNRLARWQDYTDSLVEAGVMLANGRLQTVDAATTVRVRGGETLISDGPFAETKEFLAGFYLVDCPDLDAALKYAERMPLEDYGSVEVRPMMFPAGTPRLRDDGAGAGVTAGAIERAELERRGDSGREDVPRR